MVIVTMLVIASLLSYIYLWNADAIKTEIKQSCITLCNAQLNQSKSLSSGPCLSEKIANDWVCDVAHNPRQEIDNLPENQCTAFRTGYAHHFVEVDENCELIRNI